ncbi:MAG TPA: hypothetical protein VE527_25150, partial [Reyranella sp.]|nr:hypothetical protein [Reyranella sp.]
MGQGWKGRRIGAERIGIGRCLAERSRDAHDLDYRISWDRLRWDASSIRLRPYPGSVEALMTPTTG